MKPALSTWAFLLAAAVLTGGCSSSPPAATDAPATAGKEKETAQKRAGLERDLALAREKIAKAKRDLADQEASGSASLAKAKGDLDVVQGRLKTFDEKEAPNKLAKARLDLQMARDQNDDAKEELEQLELMYKDQDLADKTREIVIRRTKRQLARTEDHLKLQEDDLKILEERTIPQDREKIALELADKQRALVLAQRASEASLHEKRIALMAAEADVARIERELESLASQAKAST